MRALILLLLVFSNSSIAAGEGDLQFALAGRQYATQNAVGLLRIKNGKCRILVAVKDINQRSCFMVTADVPGNESSRCTCLRLTPTYLLPAQQPGSFFTCYHTNSWRKMRI
jgi:hypothetical protein